MWVKWGEEMTREFHEAGMAGMTQPGKGLSWAGMKGVCPQVMPLSKAETGSGSVCGALLRHLGARGSYRKFQSRSVL